jgi:putative chitinase
VRTGETLYCIARAYGVDPFAIANANGVVNPNLVFPGMVLAIPNVPRSLPSGRTCPSQFAGGAGVSVGAASGCRWVHPVSWGQNLFRISLRYGVSMSRIAQANGISNPNLIYAGQTLCIP